MPTFNFLGKDKVIAHKPPFHFLDKKYSVGNSENMIIHGDNLIALKSLLPKFEGRIKCIYIDPPYNTGNEGWIYNDNMNDPRLQKWIGEIVGREGEDLSRHDKWLCMMYPRLRLLQRLLADDGAIFISIDDNEQANLKLICDEIFGANNFVALIPWRKRVSKSDVSYGISQDYEYVMCYAKKNFRAGRNIERKYYETPDFPNQPWRTGPLTKQTTAEERPNSFFTMINPKTGEEYPASKLRTWAITKETFPQYYAANKIIFPGDYEFLKISKPVMRYWKFDDIKKAGANFGITSVSTHFPAEIGMTQDGTKEITEIFGDKKFNFPKPSSLIQYIISLATLTDKDSIVLDSFAGSGTTAHAVINLNKADGGSRRFILIELNDYAETITAERIRRVGGEFNFYELGESLFDGDFVNPKVPVEVLREYIYFMETRKSLPPATDEKFLLGVDNGIAYYYFGEKSELNFELLYSMKTRADYYVVYAGACNLGDEQLAERNITFKQIPYNVPNY